MSLFVSLMHACSWNIPEQLWVETLAAVPASWCLLSPQSLSCHLWLYNHPYSKRQFVKVQRSRPQEHVKETAHTYTPRRSQERNSKWWGHWVMSSRQRRLETEVTEAPALKITRLGLRPSVSKLPGRVSLDEEGSRWGWEQTFHSLPSRALFLDTGIEVRHFF